MQAGILNSSMLMPLTDNQDLKNQSTKPNNNGTSFMTYLNNALQEVNNQQEEASSSARKLAAGDESYLHNTMLAFEKANLALQLTIAVRDKLVEAFQEIMRIQM